MRVEDEKSDSQIHELSGDIVRTLPVLSLDSNMISGSALSFFVEKYDLLPKLASIGLGLAVPVAIAVFDAFKARQEEKQDIEKHNLYFYYRAKKSTRGLNPKE